MRPPSPTPTPAAGASIPELVRFLRESAEALGVVLAPEAAERLVHHAALVLEAGRQVNVVGVKTLPEAVLRLVCDSLVVAPELQRLPSASLVVDFGTGGGFPGVPLALVCPDLRFALVESRRKKLEVARRCAEEMGAQNVVGYAGRLAELSAPGAALRGRATAIVTRAVSALPTLFAECRFTLRPLGRLWVWKGDPLPPEEAAAWPNAAATTGWSLEIDRPYAVYRPSRLLGFRRHAP